MPRGSVLHLALASVGPPHQDSQDTPRFGKHNCTSSTCQYILYRVRRTTLVQTRCHYSRLCFCTLEYMAAKRVCLREVEA